MSADHLEWAHVQTKAELQFLTNLTKFACGTSKKKSDWFFGASLLPFWNPKHQLPASFSNLTIWDCFQTEIEHENCACQRPRSSNSQYSKQYRSLNMVLVVSKLRLRKSWKSVWKGSCGFIYVNSMWSQSFVSLRISKVPCLHLRLFWTFQTHRSKFSCNFTDLACASCATGERQTTLSSNSKWYRYDLGFREEDPALKMDVDIV